jgi:ATP/maltotriose-dependent transcriptional regulator MalT/DNA-binding SARP family transcriptional activator
MDRADKPGPALSSSSPGLASVAGRQVVRGRLLRDLMAGPVGVVEAAAGYGKSVLARQYQHELGVATAFVPVGPPDDDPAILMGSLRRALASSNLSDLAVATGISDPGAGIERFLDALAELQVPLLVVLDDAHHLRGPDVTALVLRLARSLPGPHRLLVAARTLSAGLEPLRTLSCARLDTRALEFTENEASALVSSYRGRQPSGWELTVLLEATRGWATALVLASSAQAQLGGFAAAPGGQGGPGGPGRPGGREEMIIAPLLEPITALLSPPDRSAVVQLAHLPLLSAEIADAVSGADGTLPRLIAAGIPLARTPAGWWEMAGPVTAYLASRRDLAPDTARAAAAVYARHGDLLAALRTLLAARLPADAADLLAAGAVEVMEDAGWAALRDVVAELPAAAVREHPRLLLHLARLAETAHQADIRSEALARATAILGQPGTAADPVFRREVDAERARDLMWDERTRAQSRALAAAVVAAAGPEEAAARARSLDVLGRLASWFSADGVHAEAEGLLQQSARLARSIGQRTWEAQALVALAMGFYFALCRNERALATLDEVLAQLPARSTYRALVQNFRCDVLNELGRFAEAEVSISEIRQIGLACHEEWAIAYAAWGEAALASYAGDRERTVRAVLDAEAHRDVWYEQASGVEFLACAADYLDRVGEHEMAFDRLARASERMAGCERPVRVFGASVHGRSGDPAQAAGVIAGVMAAYDLEPQERWPLLLLDAYAAHRRGDPAAGRLAARAFDTCLELGQPRAPLWRERRVAEALLPLAQAAGSRSARTLVPDAGTLSLTLLGRFEVRRRGVLADIPPGRPARAVRAVAAAGGRMRAEELIEILWPDTDPERGRNRLRNLLSRLRLAVGDVLARDQETIVVSADVESDAALFETQARAAIAARSAGEVSRALGLARSAVGRYGGDLLPDDRYEEWADGPRQRLRHLYLELLDLLAADAADRGDVDEAVRLVRRGCEYEPLDEVRHLRLARMLMSQGRRGSARAALERARAALDELGLAPSGSVARLEAELADSPEHGPLTGDPMRGAPV